MSQREFADMLTVSQSMISFWEGAPVAQDKFPFHALQACRRYALANRIPWPLDLTDRLLEEDLILVEDADHAGLAKDSI